MEPATRDGTRSPLLPLLFCQPRASGPTSYLGRGPATSRAPPERGAQYTQTESRTSPLEGSGTSTCLPDLLGCTPALRPGGPGPPRAPLPLVHAGPWPVGPTERHRAVYRRPYTSDDHAACRGWQDAGAISAGPRTISRTTATPDTMPHSVLPTVSDHCTPAIQGKTTTSTLPYSCTPPLLVTIKGGGGLPLSSLARFRDLFLGRSGHQRPQSPTLAFIVASQHH